MAAVTELPTRYRFAGAPHEGMPPLDEDGHTLSWFEFLPPALFYLPIWAWVLWLIVRHRGATLPALANPTIPMGGFVGESKSRILDLAGAAAQAWIAPYTLIRKPAGAAPDALADQLLTQAQAAGFTVPLVLKPDIGSRGMGVQLVEDAAAIAAYIEAFPDGAEIMAQALCPETGEAGLFYIRHPGADQGDIVSLTLKYFPYVIGDGRRSLRELIAADRRAGRIAAIYRARHADRLDWRPAAGETVRLAFAGSHSRGAIFRDGAAHITEAMRARCDAIARDVDGFYFGRFDVRFADITALKRGEGFRIVEINAAGGESTHIWDRGMSIWSAWGVLRRQFSALFAIGAANRRAGGRVPTIPEAWAAWRAHKALAGRYPHTH